MNNNKTKSRNHGPHRVGEKPKNLKTALTKLFQYLGSFKTFIIFAIILACLSSIFSIIGPNKISDLANYISDGLVINTKNLEKLTTEIQSDLTEENMLVASKEILAINIDTTIMAKIDASDLKILNEFYTTKNIKLLNNVSSDTKELLFEDSYYNEILITKEDKIKTLEIFSNLGEENNYKLLSEIPTNILSSVLSVKTFEGITITGKEQAQFITKLSTLKEDANPTEIYKVIDKSSKNIYELVKPKMDMKTIKKLSLFLLCLYLLSALFNFIQSFIMATVSNKFAKVLRTKLNNKINALPLKYFDSNETGDILSRITNDVDTISISMYQSLGSLVGAITLFVGSIVMMFYTNGIMAITAIVSSLIGFVLMMLILSKSQKYFLRRQVELGKLNGHIEEIYSAHNVVKAYNGEKEALKIFNELNESVFDCNRKSQFLSGLMQPIMMFIGNFSYVMVCIVGALLVMDNKISFGVIVAFMLYVRLFTSPLSQIAQGMTNLQTTAAASERVFEFLEEKEMQDETSLTKRITKDKVKGDISFKNVKFGYDEKLIIKDFSCDVKSGQKIAIVGPTGAGKTTLVNLLMKFYNINSGEIKIDGISVNDLTRENIHDLFIMVLQDTWLFTGTIRDNIKYNKPDITDEQIWEALKTVGVSHFVKSLPNTLDYVITENDSISSGQKQLLTIARGMIENAPFLILDEATSSVDTRTEELVQKAMDKLTEGRTSFIIAHRLSTIKNADKILVMNDGNIIEQGNHDELMKLNGFYKELYSSQFKKSN